MSYFKISQRVRQELLSSPRLLDQTRAAFDDAVEPFSFGDTVNLYQIGVLSSGVYVALRMFRKDTKEGELSLPRQKQALEEYCSNAETFSSERKSVVAFCVGVVYNKNRRAGILLEDLTQGGTQMIEHDRDEQYAFVGAERKQVFIDIDHLFHSRRHVRYNYFSNRNLILL